MGTNGATVLCAPPKLLSDAERQAVREQLERMLAGPHFSHSKRYPALLRYVVEQALEGHADQIKERTLGIEVLGRAPDYDTYLDPVVRTTAGEIRKRIAQYYHEPGHQDELRIELPCGAYVPEFLAAPETEVVAAPLVEAPVQGSSSWWKPVWFLRSAIALLAAAVLLAAWFKPWAPRPALDRFWAPVLDSPSPVLLCIGQPHFKAFPGGAVQALPPVDSDDGAISPDSQVSLHDLYLMGKHHISLWDSVTMTRVAAFLAGKAKPYRIRGELSTFLSDLRDGPAVLVGAFNNNWTLRLTGPLRFSFIHPEPDVFAIRDLQNPSAAWKVDTSVAYMKQTDDYALISRVKDSTTGRVVVVAAGVAYWGTIAAGEFLTDPKYMDEVAKSAPSGWERKNMQIVIGTTVIAGNSGPPQVLATYFW